MENKQKSDLKIGFIGQGWIGKNYADNFEQRGYNIVRYGMEAEYKHNGDAIADCDIVFIAVPTPSTPNGFDDSIVRQVVKKIGKGNVAVIKSTMMPGKTELIQIDNPDIFVFHSPEFLTEATAAHDASNPTRNIVGIPEMTEAAKAKAKQVIDVLPYAPYMSICQARDAEMIKYGGNNWFYFKVVFMNMLYDLANELGCHWETIRDGMAADPRIGRTHLDPIHKNGRGAGGHCFIKDFAALTQIYGEKIGDELGVNLLEAIKEKNIDLLLSSDKDLDLLQGVYGDNVINQKGKNKKVN
jgi:UDPglucose 6-dehydrogenase